MESQITCEAYLQKPTVNRISQKWRIFQLGERTMGGNVRNNTLTAGKRLRRLPGALLLGLLLASASGARAQDAGEYRGTAVQQAACTSNVFRLCSSEIPSVERIVGCLKRERPRLSEGCHAVFSFNHRLGHHHHFASEHHGRHHFERHSERIE